jgi:hypothetical protein
MLTSPASEVEPDFGPMVGPIYVAEITRRSTVCRADRASMLDLLGVYFDGVSPARFAEDLEEKDWVILLRDRAAGSLAGFTTFMRFTCASEPGVVAFFSGDTIVRRAAWNEMLLARAWARLAFGLASREAGVEVYWFLICSGFRTYRFLPVFFRGFYPRFDAPTPAREQEISDRLATAKFGSQYDRATGVVTPLCPTRLHAGCRDVASRSDPHVSFFLTSNPGHAAGHELVCLAPLSRDNLTAAGQRMAGLR